VSDFHFLRPWWLAALVPATLLAWWLWSAEDAGKVWRKLVAPHLLARLVVGREERSWLRPVTVLLAAWLMASLALAGPAWQREPAPFADDTAALAIVIKVTPSMMAQDVQPTRIARGVEKIRDLLALRPGAKTALFAYAGSAHRVMPLTSDAGIINTFAEELAPDVMPVEGAVAPNALKAADDTVTKSGQAGWILWVADGATPDEWNGLKEYRASGRTPVSLLAVAGDGPELKSLEQAATVLDAPLVRVTPDDLDVRRLAANTRFSPADVALGGDRWRDFGYWLVWPLAVLTLLQFRRGWMVGTSRGV